jgi:quercetin dioxygenase-like cupin family protein
MSKITDVPLLLAAPPSAQAEGVETVQIFNANVTASGQPIVLPHGYVKVITWTYEIAPGAKLPEHKHLYQRYGYVLSGQLRVINTDTGKTEIFKLGDFIVEVRGQWHKAENIGIDPVKLLVIDQVAEGDGNVILRNKEAAATH